ncbi:MAG TPA: RDD family protein [Candidatus Hydrogenedentes bacterium]|nr:RDD family protein [Candidatus Hydrogenedentota bacterium]HQK74752.1 RDD family protein [Candidatus Hydrogenedentota bacterium]
MDWYYIVQGREAGPVSDATLSNLALAGALTPDTLVWRAGMQDWQPVRLAAPELVMPVSTGEATSTFGGTLSDPNHIRCAGCGNLAPSDEVIWMDNHPVCASCKPVFVQRLREGVPLTSATQVEFAGFWLRFAAKFIDGLILSPVSFGVFFVQGLVLGMNTDAEPNPFAFFGWQLLLNLFVQLVTMAYVTFFVGRFGATPGKMACRLRVVTGTLEEMTYLRAFGRFWGEFVTGMTFTIGYLIAAFDSEKRALHDYICNTRVIRV